MLIFYYQILNNYHVLIEYIKFVKQNCFVYQRSYENVQHGDHMIFVNKTQRKFIFFNYSLNNARKKLIKLILDNFNLKEYKTNAKMPPSCETLLQIEHKLLDELQTINFTFPVEYVYNPLEYASDVHEKFYRAYMTESNLQIMFLGMNPGPWGMMQNGVRDQI